MVEECSAGGIFCKNNHLARTKTMPIFRVRKRFCIRCVRMMMFDVAVGGTELNIRLLTTPESLMISMMSTRGHLLQRITMVEMASSILNDSRRCGRCSDRQDRSKDTLYMLGYQSGQTLHHVLPSIAVRWPGIYSYSFSGAVRLRIEQGIGCHVRRIAVWDILAYSGDAT